MEVIKKQPYMHEMLSHLVSPTLTQVIKTWTIDDAMIIQQNMQIF
jgi:hypothetical protein